jgi:hypothetical protein
MRCFFLRSSRAMSLCDLSAAFSADLSTRLTDGRSALSIQRVNRFLFGNLMRRELDHEIHLTRRAHESRYCSVATSRPSPANCADLQAGQQLVAGPGGAYQEPALAPTPKRAIAPGNRGDSGTSGDRTKGRQTEADGMAGIAVSADPVKRKTPLTLDVNGVYQERAMGLEPTTFTLAT